MIFPLFSTPVYVNNVGDFPRPNLDALTYTSTMPGGAAYQFLSSTDKHVLDRPEFKGVREIVMREINVYAHEILAVDRSIEFYITDSWVNQHKRGDQAGAHMHHNSLVSGVLYLRTNENSGNLVTQIAPNGSARTIFSGGDGVNNPIFEGDGFPTITADCADNFYITASQWSKIAQGGEEETRLPATARALAELHDFKTVVMSCRAGDSATHTTFRGMIHSGGTPAAAGPSRVFPLLRAPSAWCAAADGQTLRVGAGESPSSRCPTRSDP